MIISITQGGGGGKRWWLNMCTLPKVLFSGESLANNLSFANWPPANNFLFSGGHPANNFLFAVGPPANKFLFAGGPPANNLFLYILKKKLNRVLLKPKWLFLRSFTVIYDLTIHCFQVNVSFKWQMKKIQQWILNFDHDLMAKIILIDFYFKRQITVNFTIYYILSRTFTFPNQLLLFLFSSIIYSS